MDNLIVNVGERFKLRANRKVIEQQCLICQQGFQLAEEVYACSDCGGYHHVMCWDANRICPGQTVLPYNSTEPAAPSLQADTVMPVDRATSVGAAVVIDTVEPSNTVAVATPENIQEPEAQPAEDERYCPGCGKVIKQKALKCRFCDRKFDERLIETTEAGTLEKKNKESSYQVGEEIETHANRALQLGIASIFIFSYILAPMAIGRGVKGIKLLGEYPTYDTYSSARIKATAGIVIAGISLVARLCILFGS